MKKLPALFSYAFIYIIGISCIYNDHNTDISFSESAHYYSMGTFQYTPNEKCGGIHR